MKSEQRPLTGKKLKRKQSPRQPSSKSSGEIELLRMRVASAESLLEETLEQANLAKRRRKLAKLLAKRARRGAKQAKANLAKARKTLAAAEAKLADSGARVAIRKPARARTRSVARGVVAAPGKKAVSARKGRPRPAALSPAEAALTADDNRRTAKRKTSRPKPVARSASASAPKRSAAQRKSRDLSRGTLSAATEPPTTPGRLEEIPVTLDAETAQPARPAVEFQRGPDSEAIAETQVKIES